MQRHCLSHPDSPAETVQIRGTILTLVESWLQTLIKLRVSRLVQGFEWTFGWNEGAGDGDGFPYLADEWNVTETGEIEIDMDIRNQPDWYGFVGQL